MDLFTPAWVLAAVACAAAVYTDVRTRRVPNFLTLPLLLAGPLIALPHGGVRTAAISLGVVVAVLALGAALHAIGIMGGGDVKLLAGCCGLLGLSPAVQLLLYTALAGGVLAIGFAILRRRLRTVTQRTMFALNNLLATGTAVVPESSERMPYAIAIAAGLALDFASLTVLPQLRFLP